MTYPPNPPPINYEDELYNSNNEETPLLEDNTKLAKLYSRNSKKKKKGGKKYETIHFGKM